MIIVNQSLNVTMMMVMLMMMIEVYLVLQFQKGMVHEGRLEVAGCSYSFIFFFLVIREFIYNFLLAVENTLVCCMSTSTSDREMRITANMFQVS